MMYDYTDSNTLHIWPLFGKISNNMIPLKVILNIYRTDSHIPLFCLQLCELLILPLVAGQQENNFNSVFLEK